MPPITKKFSLEIDASSTLRSLRFPSRMGKRSSMLSSRRSSSTCATWSRPSTWSAPKWWMRSSSPSPATGTCCSVSQNKSTRLRQHRFPPVENRDGMGQPQ